MVSRRNSPAAFSLLTGVKEDIDTLTAEASKRCQIDRAQIQDILPCSPFQHDVTSSTSDNPQNAVGQALLELSDAVDLERLYSAWEEAVRSSPILRTRMFTVPSGSHLQVVLAEGIAWRSVNSNIDVVVTEEQTAAAVPGAQCNRYALVTTPDSNQRTLVWTFSHAMVDHGVQRQILQKVQAVYDGDQVQSSLSMGNLLEHIAALLEVDESSWPKGGTHGTSFPPLLTDMKKPYPRARAVHQFSCAGLTSNGHPAPIVCQAALAALLSRYTRDADVAFDVVSERPPLLDTQPCVVDGPTRSLRPCHVHLEPGQSLSDLMDAIEEWDTAMHSFEQAGLAKSADTKNTKLQTVLAVTSAGDRRSESSLFRQAASQMDMFLPYTHRALLLECQLSSDSVSIIARYDPDVINDTQIYRFLRQLGRLVEQFCGGGLVTPLQELDAMTEEDREEIFTWNSTSPPESRESILDLIAKTVKSSPQHAAISAWDGELSYAELDDLSTRLALHIPSLDIGNEAMIPLCFEKSKWTVVSLFAVMKAGAAFTLIDPFSMPLNRIGSLCKQISARVAFICESQRQSMESLVTRCITVDDNLLQSLPSGDRESLPKTKARDLAYVQFTSGEQHIKRRGVDTDVSPHLFVSSLRGHR